MKVHLKAVIRSGLEKGVILGFHRATKQSNRPPMTDAKAERFVNTVIDSIWECLDPIVDFSDDDNDNSDKSRPIGFVTDAVGSSRVPEFEKDEEDDVVPLD
jgi:hypothetical protein